MNETINKKLSLYNERKITEENKTIISDEELVKKLQFYHNECLKWHEMVEEWLNENS